MGQVALQFVGSDYQRPSNPIALRFGEVEPEVPRELANQSKQNDDGTVSLVLSEPIPEIGNPVGLEFGKLKPLERVLVNQSAQNDDGTVSLRLTEPMPEQGNPVDLRLGAFEFVGGQPDAPEGVIAGQLLPPSGDIQARFVIPVTLAGALPGLSGSVVGEIDINVNRGPKLMLAALPHEDARPIGASSVGQWTSPLRVFDEAGAQWDAADGIEVKQTNAFDNSDRLALRTGTVYEQAGRVAGRSASEWQYTKRIQHRSGVQYEQAAYATRVRSNAYEDATRTNTAFGSDWYKAAGLQEGYRGIFRTLGGIAGSTLSGRYEQAINPPSGAFGGIRPPEPPEPPVPPQDFNIRLCSLLEWIEGNRVRFTTTPCEPPPVGPDDPIEPPDPLALIPALRFYVMSNSAQIVRVSDGRDVPAQAVRLAVDVDGFAWSMSATLAGRDALALFEGADPLAPVAVDVDVNGYTWRILIDAWNKSTAWDRSQVTIRGRSQTAILAAPFVEPRDFTHTGADRLVQQLAGDELPPGWTLQWDAADWLVPANAWSYQGQTPIGAIQKLAAAAAAFIEPSRTAQALTVRPLYPTAPWQWNSTAADLTIPPDFVVQASSQKQPGAGIDGLFVQGGQFGGVLGRVQRTGTGGARLGDPVVNDLVTHLDAARALGIAAIAGSVAQSRETYELPLSATYGGLVTPGTLVSLTENPGTESALEQFRGMVRSTSVSAQARRTRTGASLQVRQSIDIERHLEN